MRPEDRVKSQGVFFANRRQQLQARRLIKQVDAHVLWLRRQISAIESEFDAAIRQTPLWRDEVALLERVPGIGLGLIRTLLIELPELGRLSRRQISAFVRVAPMADDTGTLHGTSRAAARGCGASSTWRR